MIYDDLAFLKRIGLAIVVSFIMMVVGIMFDLFLSYF